MIPQELLKLIRSGESMTVEFKKSRTEITKPISTSRIILMRYIDSMPAKVAPTM